MRLLQALLPLARQIEIVNKSSPLISVQGYLLAYVKPFLIPHFQGHSGWLDLALEFVFDNRNSLVPIDSKESGFSAAEIICLKNFSRKCTKATNKFSLNPERLLKKYLNFTLTVTARTLVKFSMASSFFNSTFDSHCLHSRPVVLTDVCLCPLA